MFETMLDLDDIKPDGIRGLTRAEYDQLIKLGAFDGEKIELLRGQLVTVSPIGMPHIRLTVWMNRYLIERLDRAYEVHPGQPFAASDDSEPEPDMMVVPALARREDLPTQALILMEFSDSSIRKDRRLKLSIYAEAGVPEYWIFDLSRVGELVVEVYREPTGSRYASVTQYRDGDVLRPLMLPLEIPVAEIPR